MPAIYAGADNAAQILGEELVVYPLWIAEYDVDEPTMDNLWETWAGWQYTDMGRVAGIQGHVDRDIFTEEILEESSEPITRSGERPSYRIRQRTYRIYRIRSGDTLFSIAQRFGVEVEALEQLNKMKDPNLIYAGQLLKIP